MTALSDLCYIYYSTCTIPQQYFIYPLCLSVCYMLQTAINNISVNV